MTLPRRSSPCSVEILAPVAESEAERVTRETMEAWNASLWDRFEELWDPDAEVVTPPTWPESGTFRGWAEIRREYERLKDTWAVDRLEVLSLESRDNRALAHGRWSAIGQASGFPFDLEVWWVGEVRKGRNWRLEHFIDEQSARRAFDAVKPRK
jgi:ketosteroid isomerase-like protein